MEENPIKNTAIWQPKKDADESQINLVLMTLREWPLIRMIYEDLHGRFIPNAGLYYSLNAN